MRCKYIGACEQQVSDPRFLKSLGEVSHKPPAWQLGLMSKAMLTASIFSWQMKVNQRCGVPA